PAANPVLPGDGSSEDLDDEEQQPGRGPGARFGAAAAMGPSLMTRSSRGGVPVVRLSSTGDVYLTGTDRPGGVDRLPQPFIDKVNIKTGQKTRIFVGNADMLETIDAVDGDDVKRVLSTRQKQDVVPDVPIVGPAGRMNDNYIPDLRNSLWAVIDDLDRRGLIDRDRLAVGGHSYGAFSTANALAHTPFFKAGIAGDGNYNRTLTPTSFQTERRLIWDARETYLEMSPLLWANRINGALLMYHGMDDANVGTNPVN